MLNSTLEKQMAHYFQEDDLGRNLTYFQNLPHDLVNCEIKIKDDLILCGLPYFFEAFNYLSDSKMNYDEFLVNEGKSFQTGDNSIQFTLPFHIALTGERIALNLLQKASAIATYTSKFVKKLEGSGISVLDTRKTLPGYRALEKYAVNIGGGQNHRFGQTDVWMIKDNHKTFFGGLEQAYQYFKSMNSFYTPVVVEIHNIAEIKEAKNLGINHLMLDNFTPTQVQEAIEIKESNMTYEVSGGINLNNIENYLIKGVDAISTSAITSPTEKVDISFKYKKL
jgi:nicotinate-nucleotide pyrophosphorylase (carboxylating)